MTAKTSRRERRANRRRRASRVPALMLAIPSAAIAWLSCEFVRARMTEGLSWRVQVCTMGVPMLVGLMAGRGCYRATMRG